MRIRLNLKDAVADLCPAPPPCFRNHLDWREYLQSAAAVQNNHGEQKVILIVNGEAAFNFAYNLCEDCNQIKSLEMYQKGKCSPNHLKDMIK